MAEENGRWVTLDNGVHLFIKKGQTLDDAIEQNISKGDKKEQNTKIVSEKVKKAKEYFETWGQPNRNELQEVVNFYGLTKDEAQELLGGEFKKEDIDNLKFKETKPNAEKLETSKPKYIGKNYGFGNLTREDEEKAFSLGISIQEDPSGKTGDYLVGKKENIEKFNEYLNNKTDKKRNFPNKNFDEKTYGRFFDDEGYLKEGMEEEYLAETKKNNAFDFSDKKTKDPKRYDPEEYSQLEMYDHVNEDLGLDWHDVKQTYFLENTFEERPKNAVVELKNGNYIEYNVETGERKDTKGIDWVDPWNRRTGFGQKATEYIKKKK